MDVQYRTLIFLPESASVLNRDISLCLMNVLGKVRPTRIEENSSSINGQTNCRLITMLMENI